MASVHEKVHPDAGGEQENKKPGAGQKVGPVLCQQEEGTNRQEDDQGDVCPGSKEAALLMTTVFHSELQRYRGESDFPTRAALAASPQRRSTALIEINPGPSQAGRKSPSNRGHYGADSRLESLISVKVPPHAGRERPTLLANTLTFGMPKRLRAGQAVEARGKILDGAGT
jgi:hypothetical protein